MRYLTPLFLASLLLFGLALPCSSVRAEINDPFATERCHVLLSGPSILNPEDIEQLTQEYLEAEGSNLSRAKKRVADIAKLGLSAAEVRAISNYTSFDFEEINRSLRRGVSTNTAEFQSALILFRGVNRLPILQGVSYRGLVVSQTEAQNYLKVGNLVHELGFLSSDRKMENAIVFTLQRQEDRNRNTRILFEIRGRSGRSIQMISHARAEDEVLFLPGSRFHVTSVKQEGLYWRVELDDLATMPLTPE